MVVRAVLLPVAKLMREASLFSSWVARLQASGWPAWSARDRMNSR